MKKYIFPILFIISIAVHLSVSFFGLNQFSTRAVSALAGTLSVVSFFFLINIFFKKKYLSLLAVFLLGFEP